MKSFVYLVTTFVNNITPGRTQEFPPSEDQQYFSNIKINKNNKINLVFFLYKLYVVM